MKYNTKEFFKAGDLVFVLRAIGIEKPFVGTVEGSETKSDGVCIYINSTDSVFAVSADDMVKIGTPFKGTEASFLVSSIKFERWGLLRNSLTSKINLFIWKNDNDGYEFDSDDLNMSNMDPSIT